MVGSQILKLTSCIIDLKNHEILRGSEKIGLTPLEAGLLEVLSEGQTVSRDELLHRVWGYREGVVTRAVDKTVARLRSKLDVDPQAPIHIINVRGVGYRLEGILNEDRPPATAPPAATEESLGFRAEQTWLNAGWRERNTNLEDWEVRSFVGRTEEGRLREMIARDARLISLLGPGGSGKTRLARRVGADLASSFSGGVWFVDLTEVRTSDGLVSAIGQTFDIPASASSAAERLEGALMSRGKTLLILDNAEQIAAHVASLLSRWTHKLRDTRFLVTTRERLRIGAEQCLELEPLSEEEAIALFLERAREAGARVDADDREPLLRMVTALDRMPLAVELAAARVRLFGLRELTERISRDLSVLKTGLRDVSAREATMTGAIGWSWDLLSEEERCTLCQASLFSGGFGLAMVSAFDLRAEALSLVEALADKSMLRVSEDELGRRRFRMYECIRVFASDRSDGRLRQAPLGLARAVTEEIERHRAAISARHGEVAFRALLLERDNALVAFAIAQTEAPQLAIRIAIAVAPAFAATGPHDEAERILSAAIALARSKHAPLLARALLARGSTRSSLALLSLAREDLEEALTLAGDDPELILQLRSELGHLCRLLAQTREAAAHYEAALLVAPSGGFATALLHARMGRLLANVGQLESADEHLAIALDLARIIGNARLEGDVLGSLGWVAAARLDFALAIDLEEEALGLARLASDRRAEALARMAIGTAQMESGAFSEAIDALGDATSALASVGDRRAEAIARCHLGICALARGELPQARSEIEAALERLDGVGDEVNVGVIESNLAEIHHLSGELDRASEVLDRSLQRLRRGGVDALTGSVLAQLAAVEADRGELARSAALLREAEALLSLHPKPIELGVLAIRRLHLRLAESREDSARLDIRAEAEREGPEPTFLFLARRQLARSLRARDATH